MGVLGDLTKNLEETVNSVFTCTQDRHVPCKTGKHGGDDSVQLKTEYEGIVQW